MSETKLERVRRLWKESVTPARVLMEAILDHLEEQQQTVDLAQLLLDLKAAAAPIMEQAASATPRETLPSLPAIESTEGQSGTNDTSSMSWLLVKAVENGELRIMVTVMSPGFSSHRIHGNAVKPLLDAGWMPATRETSALLSLSGSTPSNAKEVALGDQGAGRSAGEAGHD